MRMSVSVGPLLTLERQPLEKRDPLQEKDFSSIYIGYDEGINVEVLDSTANWQF